MESCTSMFLSVLHNMPFVVEKRNGTILKLLILMYFYVLIITPSGDMFSQFRLDRRSEKV